MKARIAGLASALTLTFAFMGPFVVRADALTIGDPAPPLTVSKWVKGEKVDKLDPGQIYVVEFWATWCGPCRSSIPHLTELQKKNKGVIFLGVDVWEHDLEKVEPFVKEMGEKMDYRVALDDVPSGPEDKQEGKMAAGWMKAAEADGIPTAFIVGKDGRIAWIGHPMAMEEPLAKVIDGSWDLKAAASQRAEALAEKRAIRESFEKIVALRKDQAKNSKEIVAQIDKAVDKMPALAARLAPMKYEALLHGADRDAAAAYGAELVDSTFKDNVGTLYAIASMIVGSRSEVAEKDRDVKLALRAAQRANDLSQGKFYPIVGVLAEATFLSGDAARAVELQEKAIKLAPQKIPAMQDRLDVFRKAVDSK